MYRLKILVALLLAAVGLCCAQAAPIDLWHLDEGFGSTTADAVGSNPGSLFNSPQWVSGVASNALKFNGTNQYVRVKSGAILGNAANYTIEAWVKWDGRGLPGSQMIYCEGSFNDIIDLLLINGVPTFITLSGNWYMAAGSAAVSANEWHHLAGVLQAGLGGILYVDGQAIATNANMGAATQGTSETDIGRFAGGGGSRYFSGTIDEVQVFNNARTAAEILADYQQLAAANLGVTKIASPDPVFVGSNLTYTIVITNSGAGSAASVTLTDALPANVTFVSAASTQGAWTNQAGVVVGTLGTITNGGSATVAITVTMNASGQITNTCAVTTASFDSNLSNNTSSAVATANVAAVSITTQPITQTISAGGNATFTVQASGSPPLSYQWQFNGTNIDGATDAIFVVTNAAAIQGGLYSVIVSNAAGPVTSSNAVLTVTDLGLYAVLTAGGPIGRSYAIQYVNDVNDTNWITATNVTLSSSPYFYVDFGSRNRAKRFYRAVLLP